MGRPRKEIKAGDKVNGFEIVKAWPGDMYAVKCLKCGRISEKSKTGLKRYGCKFCSWAKRRTGPEPPRPPDEKQHTSRQEAEQVAAIHKAYQEKLKAQAAAVSRTHKKRVKAQAAAYSLEGLLNLRNEIIMQAAKDTRAKDKHLQEAAWRFFESDNFKSLCIDLDYEIVIQEIKKAKRFRQLRP